MLAMAICSLSLVTLQPRFTVSGSIHCSLRFFIYLKFYLILLRTCLIIEVLSVSGRQMYEEREGSCEALP